MSHAATVLHCASTALVVIDIQERLAAVMQHRDRVVAQTTLLVRTAAIVGAPIIATRQYPKGLGDHCAEIAAVLAEATEAGARVVEVDKVTFDCFLEPEFVAAVESTGRRQLLLTGMESHICVCQTTLAGLRDSYDVHVAADACCSRDDTNHDMALLRLSSAGGVITTAESAAYELVGRAGTPEFKALLAAVKGETPPAR